MNLDIQFRLKSNENYIKYIRENSYWYKILNRNPMMFRTFEEEVKEKFQLRPMDRAKKALETLEMLQAIMSTIK